MAALVSFRQFVYGSEEYLRACRLRNAVLRVPLGLSLRDEDLAGEAAQLHFGLFSADGTLMACVSAVPLSATRAKVRQMAVAPESQGQGLGHRVMIELEAALKTLGYRQLELHARQTAVGFYAKLGYGVVGEEFLEVGIPHLAMEKVV